MKKIIIIILVIISFLLFCDVKVTEKLEDLGFYSDFNKRNKCCNVKKVLNNNKFEYQFILTNQCDNSFSSNSRNIMEGELIDGKPFELSMCNKENQLIGSCRNRNFECIDFTSPEDCKKYKLKWSDKTCHDRLENDIVYSENIVMSGTK